MICVQSWLVTVVAFACSVQHAVYVMNRISLSSHHQYGWDSLLELSLFACQMTEEKSLMVLERLSTILVWHLLIKTKLCPVCYEFESLKYEKHESIKYETLGDYRTDEAFNRYKTYNSVFQ